MASKIFFRIKVSICFILMVSFSFMVCADEKFDSFFKGKKYDEAITYCEKNIPEASRSVDTWLKLAKAYQKTNASESKAKECYVKAEKIAPGDPRVTLGLGHFMFKAKNYNGAVKMYQKSYLAQRSVAASEGIARAAMQLKHFDMAQDAAESAIMKDSTADGARMILYQLHFAKKKYARAAEQLQSITTRKKDNLKLWKQLAFCYEKLKQPSKLIHVDPMIIKLDKKNIKSRQRHGKYLMEKKKYVDAYMIYRELEILTPKKAYVFENLYLIAKSKNRDDDAQNYLTKYLSLDSSSAKYNVEIAQILYKKKDPNLALKYFRRAFKINKKENGLYKNYVDLLIKNKKVKETEIVIKAAIAVKQADAGMKTVLGDRYKKRKNYTQAITLYQDVLKKEPRNMAVLKSLGECQSSRGLVKDAIITFEQIITFDPKASQEHKYLGDLYTKAGKHDKAASAYERYSARVPSDQKIARKIGLKSFGEKKYKKAVKYLEMVNDISLMSVRYYIALGESYYLNNKYKKAAAVLSKIKKTKVSAKTLKTSMKYLGDSYEKIGKPDLAVKAYRFYINLSNVRDPDISYTCAYLSEKINKTSAIKIYSLNIRKFPKDYRNFLRLGIIYSESANSAVLQKSSAMLQKPH